LEEYLLRFPKTLLFVTHDRLLLKRLATRIIELDRGDLADWSCDYDTFLERKQSVLEAEEKGWANIDKKQAQEEIWIRRGIRARRTRNEGRVQALFKMREERKNRRLREGNAAIKLSEADKSGKIVMQAQAVSFNYDNKPLIADFSATISRGFKIGIIGPNGCGKTTLINLLLGKLKPQKGSIKHGSNLEIAYFDQMREQLDESQTVWENVIPNGNMVTINGKDRHIITYLQDFLFTPERAKTPVRNLSGGERNRLLLARLFTRPANLLIFDEPTNDLDTETLELLEELLVDFKGTVLLISHDRAFLNNVVSSTFVFGSAGSVKEYIGGYDDWLLQQQARETETKPVEKITKKKLYREEKKSKQTKKRTFKENKELKSLPGIIESLEDQLEVIHNKMADPDIYRLKDEIITLKEKLAAVESELSQSYTRWEYLESIEE
jgi:ATP-binding cassette subfamily F protein uup